MITKTYKYCGYTIEKHIGGWVGKENKTSYLIRNRDDSHTNGEYVQSEYANNRTDCNTLAWAKSKVGDNIWETSPQYDGTPLNTKHIKKPA